MNRWFKYILITTLFMFIGFSGVSAKTCYYNYSTSGMSGNAGNLDVKVTIDDNKPSKKPSAVINTFKDSSNLSNNEKIANWDSSLADKFKSTGKCPTYVSVTKGIFGYNVYLNYKRATATKHCSADNSKVNSKGKPYGAGYSDNCVLATSDDFNSTDTKSVDQCKNLLNEYTNIVNSQANFEYTTDGCKDIETGKKYTAFSECKQKASSNLSVIKEHNNEINTCVSNGYLSKSDISSYEDSYSKAVDNLENFSTDVEQENENYQKGITKPEKDFADSCDDAGETITLLKQIYTLLRYLIPVAIIVLAIADFIKVVATGDDKAFKSVWSRFVKRIIVGIVILILPAILSLIISLSGITETYDIDSSNIFCIFK